MKQNIYFISVLILFYCKWNQGLINLSLSQHISCHNVWLLIQFASCLRTMQVRVCVFISLFHFYLYFFFLFFLLLGFYFYCFNVAFVRINVSIFYCCSRHSLINAKHFLGAKLRTISFHLINNYSNTRSQLPHVEMFA